MIEPTILRILLFGLVLAGFVVMVVRSYKRCPPDKILVVYGLPGRPGFTKCIHGGGAFVIPVFQGFAFLDLTPVTIDLRVEDFPLLKKLGVASRSTFVVGISTEPGIMERAAERLLGLQPEQIRDLALHILVGEIERTLGRSDAEDSRGSWDQLISSLTAGIDRELDTLGLRLLQATFRDRLDQQAAQ